MRRLFENIFAMRPFLLIIATNVLMMIICSVIWKELVTNNRLLISIIVAVVANFVWVGIFKIYKMQIVSDCKALGCNWLSIVRYPNVSVAIENEKQLEAAGLLREHIIWVDEYCTRLGFVHKSDAILFKLKY